MQEQNKNWWGRNWKWFVPVGCLSTMILVMGFVSVIIFFVFSVMKSSDVYEDALLRAKENIRVIESIGTPIEEGFSVTGDINVSDGSGQADLSIPVSGPNGDAVIYLVAQKSAGEWVFSTLIVEIKNSGERIDLLDDF